MAGLFRGGGICAVVVGRTAAEMRRGLRLALRGARTVELRLAETRAFGGVVLLRYERERSTIALCPIRALP